MQTVVLDALIPREDFEIVSDIGNGEIQEIKQHCQLRI